MHVDARAATISYFIGEYRFLSNFFVSPLVYDGRIWKSAEHAYQAAKTDNAVSQHEIWKAETPSRAKYIGRHVTLRAGWDRQRVSVMKEILAAKFRRGGELGRRLIATHPKILIDGNQWGDRFWGAVRVGQDWQGENWLGKLLMDRRQELREERGLFE